MSELPLNDLRIVDLTRLLPGGYASLMLMELGAEVIKVEEVAGGDGVRSMFSQPGESESAAHLVLSRGKRSIAIDLKDARGQEILRKLLATADVLLDSFRPGVLDRLGLSEAQLAQVNPRLVHVSITAFGAASELASQPTHDLNAQGYAGALGLTADGEGKPVIPGVQISDLASGLQAVAAVLAGVRQVEKTGEGFRADVSMTDSALSMLMLPASTMLSTGQSPQPPDMFTGQLACYRLYECADSRWITVGGLEPKFFGKMVNLLDRPELAQLQYDPAAQEQLHTEFEAIFGQRSRAEWIDLLGLADTCVGPVYSIAEALDSPDAKRRGAVRTAEYRDGIQAVVPAAVHWVDPASQLVSTRRAPLLGEDSIELLGELGIAAEDVDSLIESGIVRPSD